MFGGKYIAKKIKQARLKAGLKGASPLPDELTKPKNKLQEYSASRERVKAGQRFETMDTPPVRLSLELRSNTFDH